MNKLIVGVIIVVLLLFVIVIASNKPAPPTNKQPDNSNSTNPDDTDIEPDTTDDDDTRNDNPDIPIYSNPAITFAQNPNRAPIRTDFVIDPNAPAVLLDPNQINWSDWRSFPSKIYGTYLGDYDWGIMDWSKLNLGRLAKYLPNYDGCSFADLTVVDTNTNFWGSPRSTGSSKLMVNGVSTNITEQEGYYVRSPDDYGTGIFGALYDQGVPLDIIQHMFTKNGMWYWGDGVNWGPFAIPLNVAYSYGYKCSVPCVNSNCVNCVSDGDCPSYVSSEYSEIAIALRDALLAKGILNQYNMN